MNGGTAEAADRGQKSVAVVAAVLVVGAAVAVAAVGLPAATRDADDVVAEARAAYDDADSYATTAVVTYDNGSDERELRATVLYAEPRKHRVEVTEPAAWAGSVAATNGTVAWYRNGTDGRVAVVPVDEANRSLLRPEVAIDRFAANASLESRGEETLDGTTTHVLVARNESANVTATLWVATDDWHLAKLRVNHTESNRSTTVRYRDFRFDASVHDSAFQPPNGTDVLRPGDAAGTTYDSFEAAQANSSLSLPAPDFGEGLAFDRATVLDRANETALQVYQNGSTEVVVVTSERTAGPWNGSNATAVEVASADARLAEVDGRLAVAWRADGVTHAVVADVGRERILELAEAVAAAS